ncbi:hypothetical protein [Acidovorax sp. A1169]|uniref:hypothetical protein n=1 Tax=Acidovorax sp. A1169 TaxID=3059524 RepID=UPI0027379681|nr:hypothetical protein [Acidovorax sp. A1169]MDP4076259.1 hypothetical protein [Acidovorax sp. A1169]
MWHLQDRNGNTLVSGTGPVAWNAERGGWETPETCYADPDRQMVLAPEPVLESRHITRLAFRNRFTQAEKIGLELAALDKPAGTMPERTQAAALRTYLEDAAAATFVDLARTDTRAGVQFLETAGLLAAGRALQILDTPILPTERPL